MLGAAREDPAIGAALRRSFEDAVRPAPVRPLATIEALAALQKDDVVGWRTGLRARIEDDERVVRIVLRRKTVTLPAEASAAVHSLRAADHAAGALPGLDRDSSLVVARRLLREGVLVPR
jgi:hypothetical protein